MPHNAKLDDLVRRNRLLMASASHVARDTAWIFRCIATDRAMLRGFLRIGGDLPHPRRRAPSN